MRADGRTPFQRAVARAYNSPIGLGGGAYHGGTEEGEAESAYLGVLRRAVLDEVGLFDETIRRGEDWELNLRIRRAGYRVWFDPSLSVTYWPRESWTRLDPPVLAPPAAGAASSSAAIGRGNSLRFFAPPALVVDDRPRARRRRAAGDRRAVRMVVGRGIRRLSAGHRLRRPRRRGGDRARRRHGVARQALDGRGAARRCTCRGAGASSSACCAARTTPSTPRASATATRRCRSAVRQAQGPVGSRSMKPWSRIRATTRSAAWPSSRALNLSRQIR